MKVQVTIKVPSKQFGDPLAVFVTATDTIASIKDRVVAAQGVPFPDQELQFAGVALDHGRRVADCGVKDGDSLDFVVRASEATLTQQITELLKVSTVSASELDHLYVHKHGVSTQEALRMLGLEISLHEFLASQKGLTVAEGGCTVSLSCSNDDRLINLRVSIDPVFPGGVETSLWADEDDDAPFANVFDITARGQETIASVAIRAASAAGIPGAFPDLQLTCDGKPLVQNMPLAACEINSAMQVKLIAGTSDASFMEQVMGLVSEHDGMTAEELGLMFSSKYGVDVHTVLRSINAPMQRRTFTQFLRGRPGLAVSDGCVTRKTVDALALLPSKEPLSIHQKCLEVHDSVSTRDFQARASQVVSKIAAVLMQATFLNIHHYVTGGSVGKGTSIEGAAAAELTLFVVGLPLADFKTKLPELLDSVTALLHENSSTGGSLQGARVAGVRRGAVHLTIDGLSSVEVCLSPTYSTHGAAIEQIQLENQPLERIHETLLAEQEVRFMKKQPEVVKITARLLKHWRGRLTWSSDKTRPSDRLLELLAVHVATSQLPRDGRSYNQGEALELIRALLIRVDTLRVVWPAPLYGKCKIPSYILEQRPLLMDPVNPFVNVASSSVFDPSEVMAYATQSAQHLL